VDIVDIRKELMIMSIMMEVWGEYAAFNRPEMKVERVSYDCPTPSAARGMIEAVYFHPGLKWVIDRIYVLNPIQFTNVRRNEVKSKGVASGAYAAMTGKSRELYIATSQDIQQRAAMMLKDVHYVIEAHFEMTDQANPADNPGKFQDIIKRRLRKGQCFVQPYLGTRECTAHFKLWEGEKVPTIQETRDLGFMLYDMDYTDLSNIQPMFFRAKMENGVIDLTDCEVFK